MTSLLPNPYNAFPHDGNGLPVAVMYGIIPDTHMPSMTDTYLPVLVDLTTKALTELEEEHAQIHSGHYFMASRTPNLSGNGSYRFSLATPSGLSYCHMLLSFNTEQGTQVVLYEGTKGASGGDVLPIFNRNRNSASTPGLSIRYGVSTTSDGTAIWAQQVGAGGGTAGVSRADNEIVLKLGSTYTVGITNLAAGTDYVNFTFNWYEIPNN